MGARKNGCARRRNAKGERALSPLACLPRERPFSLVLTNSKRLLRRLFKRSCPFLKLVFFMCKRTWWDLFLVINIHTCRQGKVWIRPVSREMTSLVGLLVKVGSALFLLLSQLSRRTSRGNAYYAGYFYPGQLFSIWTLWLSQPALLGSR